jgi:hypothetical protein
MSASQTLPLPGQALADPLRGRSLAIAALLVWLAGAAYCHGYERLLSGLAEWPGSLIWSGLAVMPWFALFELSKTPRGRRLGTAPLLLAAALAGTATLSLLLELSWHATRGAAGSPVALMVMRRLPAIGASLVLILWAAAAHRRRVETAEAAGDLAGIAEAIEWVAAADNYVELHVGGRVLMRRMTMREAERQLARFGFVRIHRRFLVNGRKLEGIVGSNGDRRVRIGGALLPVGRAFAPGLPDRG